MEFIPKHAAKEWSAMHLSHPWGKSVTVEPFMDDHLSGQSKVTGNEGAGWSRKVILLCIMFYCVCH